MKLSEILKYTHTRTRTTEKYDVAYSWISTGRKSACGTRCFALYLSAKILAAARVRDDDKCDIEIDEHGKTLTLAFGAGLPFSLIKRTADGGKIIRIARSGIETLQAILPDKDGVFALKPAKTETCKISACFE